VRSIRGVWRFSHLPIRVVTAKAMPGDREKYLEARISDYLAKPVDTDTIAGAPACSICETLQG
jgi:CheY-like chemotaxis protein